MGSSPKTPPPPNYQALAAQDAAAQQEMLRQQTIANRPNQQNVYGSLNWTKDPTTGEWTQTEQMAPWMQGLFNQAFDAQQQTTALQNQQRFDVGALMGQGPFQGQAYGNEGIDAGRYQAMNLGMGQYNPMNLNMGQYLAQGLGVDPYKQQQVGVGQFQSKVGIPGQFQSQYDPNKTKVTEQYNAKYDPNSDEFSKMFTKSLLARVTPQQKVDEKAMQTQLRLQGLQPGTEAYNRAYQNMLTAHGDVQAQAQLQGMLAGGEEGRARSGETRAISAESLRQQLAKAQEARDVSSQQQGIYGTQLQGAIARQQQEQGVYGTQLQSALARGQFGRDEYNQALQSGLARGQYGMQQYNTQLQSALARGQYGQEAYKTQLESALARGQYGQEAYKTMFDAEKARAEFDRTGQQQQWQQQMQQYLLPGEIAQRNQDLISGAQGPSLYDFRPSFQNFLGAGQGTAANMMDAAQQGYATQVQRANEAAARKQQQGSMWGSIIGGVAGAFVGNPAAGAAVGGAVGSAFSDMDLKDEIEVVSDEDAYRAMLLIQPYSFTWPSGKRATGLLAQEVQRVFPHLVHTAEQGYLKVDYEAFTALLLGAFRHLAKQQEK